MTDDKCRPRFTHNQNFVGHPEVPDGGVEDAAKEDGSNEPSRRVLHFVDMIEGGTAPKSVIYVWPRAEAPAAVLEWLDAGCNSNWDQRAFTGLDFIAEVPPQFSTTDAPAMLAKGTWFQHPQIRGWHLVLFS